MSGQAYSATALPRAEKQRLQIVAPLSAMTIMRHSVPLQNATPQVGQHCTGGPDCLRARLQWPREDSSFNVEENCAVADVKEVARHMMLLPGPSGSTGAAVAGFSSLPSPGYPLEARVP